MSWDLSRQGINAEIAKVLAEYVSASTALTSLECVAYCRRIPSPLSAAADTSTRLPFAGLVSTAWAQRVQSTFPRA